MRKAIGKALGIKERKQEKTCHSAPSENTNSNCRSKVTKENSTDEEANSHIYDIKEVSSSEKTYPLRRTSPMSPTEALQIRNRCRNADIYADNNDDDDYDAHDASRRMRHRGSDHFQVVNGATLDEEEPENGVTMTTTITTPRAYIDDDHDDENDLDEESRVTNHDALRRRGFSKDGTHMTKVEEAEEIEGDVSYIGNGNGERRKDDERGEEEEREEEEDSPANEWRRTSDGRIIEIRPDHSGRISPRGTNDSGERKNSEAEGDEDEEDDDNWRDSIDAMRCRISTTATVSSQIVSTESIYPDAFADALTRLSDLGMLLHEAHDLLQAHSSSSASMASRDKKFSQEASLCTLLESAFSWSLQRDVKLLKTLTRTRKERLEPAVGRINSEVNYLAMQCQPDLARELEEILGDVTANLESSPARKKALMARVTRINQSFRAKRKNDDTQGQAIMKASEVRRLATLCIENQYFLQEVVWMRGRLLLKWLLQLLQKLPQDERFKLADDPRIGATSLRDAIRSSTTSREGLQDEHPLGGDSTSTASTTPSIESLQKRFRSAAARFLSAEKNLNEALESGNEKVFQLRCEEGDIYDKFLRSVSSKNYGTCEAPSKAQFEEHLDALWRKCHSMLNNESICDAARTDNLLTEMQNHMNTLRLGVYAQHQRLAALTTELRRDLRGFRREFVYMDGEEAETAEGENDDDNGDNDAMELAIRLISRLRECDLLPVNDLHGSSGKMSPWVELVSGALRAPYYSGQSDNVDEAITIIFNYPEAADIARAKFEFKESSWLLNLCA